MSQGSEDISVNLLKRLKLSLHINITTPEYSHKGLCICVCVSLCGMVAMLSDVFQLDRLLVAAYMCAFTCCVQYARAHILFTAYMHLHTLACVVVLLSFWYATTNHISADLYPYRRLRNVETMQ